MLRISPGFESKINNWAKKRQKMQENGKKRQKVSNVVKKAFFVVF